MSYPEVLCCLDELSKNCFGMLGQVVQFRVVGNLSQRLVVGQYPRGVRNPAQYINGQDLELVVPYRVEVVEAGIRIESEIGTPLVNMALHFPAC
jgi:hypothetical protein